MSSPGAANCRSLESALLAAAGFRHGFFPDAAEPAAAAALGVPERLYFVHQVHGRAVRVVSGAEPPADVAREQGDAVAARVAQLACGVRVADCVPVLLADRATGAVAAVHSGWRSTVQHIATAAVAAVRELGARDLLAAIGPCIGPCCFEIGDDVAAQIAGASALGHAAIDRSRARPHADLRHVVAAQLAAAGVRDVDHVLGCTQCDPRRFPSFRRDGKGGGRLLAAIVTRLPQSG